MSFSDNALGGYPAPSLSGIYMKPGAPQYLVWKDARLAQGMQWNVAKLSFGSFSSILKNVREEDVRRDGTEDNRELYRYLEFPKKSQHVKYLLEAFDDVLKANLTDEEFKNLRFAIQSIIHDDKFAVRERFRPTTYERQWKEFVKIFTQRYVDEGSSEDDDAVEFRSYLQHVKSKFNTPPANEVEYFSDDLEDEI